MSYIKDVDLPRHAWDSPPFLLIASPTLPVQSVEAYVGSVNHVTTKPKEVDHIPWGSPANINKIIIIIMTLLTCQAKSSKGDSPLLIEYNLKIQNELI